MIKNKEKLLFLVETTYHIMGCISAIADYYQSDRYEITICRVITDSRKKNQEISEMLIPHVNYREIYFDESNFKNIKNLKEEIAKIISKSFDFFIFYNQHSFLGMYLTSQLAKKKTYIILGSDGMKTYGKINKLAPRWKLLFLLRYRKFIKCHQLAKDSFCYRWPTLQYASVKEINEVWVQNEEFFINRSSKRVKEVKVMSSESSGRWIEQFFKFENEAKSVKTDKIIFFICMPIKTDLDRQNHEYFMNEFSIRFPNHSLLLKLHPTTIESHIAKWKETKNITIINNRFPAELYIIQLTDSIIVSAYSTASLVNNPSCRTYWLYPIMQKKNFLKKYIELINPTQHIKVVDSLEEII